MSTNSAASTLTVGQLDNLVSRAVGAILVGTIGLIHFLDVFDKFEETPYQGWMFIALILGSLVAAAMLIRSNAPSAWWLAGLCGLVPFVMYVISRSIGLPGSEDEIGNWLEALGLASLMVEACMVALAAYVLTKGRAG